MKKSILYLTLITLSISCNINRKSNLSISTFYHLPVKFISENGSNKLDFEVFGKGLSLTECEENAKLELVKQLIYQGFNQGIILKPILNDPEDIKRFQEIEMGVFKSIISKSNIINTKIFDKTQILAQSERKRNVLSIPFRVSLNYSLLDQYILKNINP